jgi:hypothetical protein
MSKGARIQEAAKPPVTPIEQDHRKRYIRAVALSAASDPEVLRSSLSRGAAASTSC